MTIERKSTRVFALPLNTIWPLVADPNQVDRWNPKLGMEGKFSFNAEIRVIFKEFATTVRKAEGPARIVIFDPPQAVGWRIGIPLLLRIDEKVFLSGVTAGTRVTHIMDCAGPMAFFARPWLARYIENYLKAGDDGLASYIEQAHSRRAPVARTKPPDKDSRRRRKKNE